jgi:hypothetical protein
MDDRSSAAHFYGEDVLATQSYTTNSLKTLLVTGFVLVGAHAAAPAHE